MRTPVRLGRAPGMRSEGPRPPPSPYLVRRHGSSSVRRGRSGAASPVRAIGILGGMDNRVPSVLSRAGSVAIAAGAALALADGSIVVLALPQLLTALDTSVQGV